MDRLWTPWRYAYVTDESDARKGVPSELSGWPDDRGCLFCNMIAAVDYAIAHGTSPDDAERAAGVVVRFMVDQFNQSRAFFLELTVVIILVIELVYLFRGRPF